MANTATIKLYKNCKIVPAKNFLVEDIDTYLNGLDKITVSDYNFKKHNLTVSLKIDMEDLLKTTAEFLDFADEYENYNYVTIQNYTDTKSWKYFVINKTYNANKTLNLDLALDSINTFGLDEDYEFDKKTEVIREHRDRFYQGLTKFKYYDDKYAGYKWITYNGVNQAEINTPDGTITIQPNTRVYAIAPSGTNRYYPASFHNQYGLYGEAQNQMYYSTFATQYTPGPAKTVIVRKIDFISEGITPQLYKKNEELILDTDADYDWYLAYITNEQEDPDNPDNIPFDICVISNETLSVKIQSADYYEISASTLTANNGYFFGNALSGTQSNNKISFNDDFEADITDFMYLYNDGTNLTLRKITGDRTAGGYTTLIQSEVHRLPTSTSTIRFYTTDNLIHCTQAQLGTVLQGSYAGLVTRINDNNSGTIKPSNPTSTAVTINNIKTLVRTDPKIYKIIKLPYCPFDLKFVGNDLILPTFLRTKQIETGGETQTYLSVSPDYYGYFTNDVNTDIHIYSDLFIDTPEDELRNDIVESKLYHSDYNQHKVAYDSFGYPIRLETLSEDFIGSIDSSSTLKMNFVMTNTTNSRFLFDFKQTLGESDKLTEDYPTILPVSRNNEICIYNSPYLNYLNNGYNYDKKQTAWQKVGGIAQMVGGAISGIGGGLGLASSLGNYIQASTMSSYFYNAWGEKVDASSGLTQKELNQQARPFGVSSILSVGQVSSAISGIVGGISTIAQAEDSLNQKLKQAEMQSVSVSGSDDVDLMSYYTNNRAKIVNYDVSDNMKSHIADLFYYCGYNTNETKVPQLDTRKDFNYIQCDAVLNNKANITNYYLDDLKARYGIGVTILHNNDGWDFEQETANLESWL